MGKVGVPAPGPQPMPALLCCLVPCGHMEFWLCGHRLGGEGRGPCPGLQPTSALPYLPGTLWSPGVLALWPQVRWCLGQPGSQTLESGIHGVFSQPGERWGRGAEMGTHSPFPEESVVPLARSAGPASQHCLLETQEPGVGPEAWT